MFRKLQESFKDWALNHQHQNDGIYGFQRKAHLRVIRQLNLLLWNPGITKKRQKFLFINTQQKVFAITEPRLRNKIKEIKIG